MNRRLTHVFAAGYVFSLAAVIVVSVLPRADLAPGPEGIDKLYHAFAYAIIAGCGALGFTNARLRVFSAFLALVTGGVLEIVQTYLPNRTGTWDDGVANAAGILIGYGTAIIMRRALATRH